MELTTWEQISGVWRPLYGGFHDHGISIEWHDFRLRDPLAWSKSFHSGSLEICLNFAGAAKLELKEKTFYLESEQIVIYVSRDGQPKAVRSAESMHRFITVEISPAYLRQKFAAMPDSLKPEIRRFIEQPDHFEPWIEVLQLPSAFLALRLQLLEPPVGSAAHDLWYQGKILEILAQTIFLPDKTVELFCHRHLRINKERIERIKYILERDLVNPPSLAMLANEVECNPFYLSRLFTQEVGASIPKYLRLKRIERAGEILIEGKMNVTDAAMAVGYSSLSAFYRAFAEIKGVLPGEYPSKKKSKR